MCKLVPAPDHESVKRIPWIQLRRAVPVEPPLRRMHPHRLRPRTTTPAAARTVRRQPPVVPDRRVRGIVLRGYEFHILVSQFELVHRFLNQVRVLVADVSELGRWNAHVQNPIASVTVPRRLQPRVVGVSVDFLFQGVKDAHPRIRTDVGTGERHCLPE